MESEEGKRREKTRKRKRVETAEEPKEPAPTIMYEKGANSEKRGENEAYTE